MFWKALASCGFCSHTQINWVWTSCIENTTIILLAFSIGSDVKNLICKSRRPAEPLWPGQLQKKRTAAETEIYFSWGRVEMWFKKGTLWIIVCVQHRGRHPHVLTDWKSKWFEIPGLGNWLDTLLTNSCGMNVLFCRQTLISLQPVMLQLSDSSVFWMKESEWHMQLLKAPLLLFVFNSCSVQTPSPEYKCDHWSTVSKCFHQWL